MVQRESGGGGAGGKAGTWERPLALSSKGMCSRERLTFDPGSFVATQTRLTCGHVDAARGGDAQRVGRRGRGGQTRGSDGACAGAAARQRDAVLGVVVRQHVVGLVVAGGRDVKLQLDGLVLGVRQLGLGRGRRGRRWRGGAGDEGEVVCGGPNMGEQRGRFSR